MLKFCCSIVGSILLFGAKAQLNYPLKKKTAVLVYNVSDTLKPVQLYSEIKVDSLIKDEPSIYATSFKNGYLGLSIDKQKNKYLVFEYGNKKDTNVHIVAQGLQVNVLNNNTFKWAYNWQKNELYKCLLTIIPDSATNTTYYTGYIFLPKEKLWKLLGSFKVNNQYSFIEKPGIMLTATALNSKKSARKLNVNSIWLQRSNGSWKELDTAIFFTNNTKFVGSINANAQLFIANTTLVAKPNVEPNINKLFYARLTNQRPSIDVTKHVDSAIQLQLDKAEIFAAVASGKIDTSASSKNVYYTILKEGNGRFVQVNDTVTIYYKGTLFKDNSVFDETKDKPATFPLKRLISGWQIGLAQCKVGGKIRLFIPSALAYSIRSRSKAIPPNSVLIFDIEVLSVK